MTDRATLKYAKTHEWVAIEGDTATIGITDFAVNLLSDLVFADLPQPGRTLKAGESFGEVESVKAVSDVYAPVSGEVISTNTELPDHLDWLSTDPYGKGWMIKVRVASAATEGLLDHAQYTAHCQAEGSH